MTQASLTAVPLPAQATGDLADRERLWVARELHDIVGYITAVIIQADLAAQPRRSATRRAEALREISEASWRAARELQAMLAVLRRADDAEPDRANPGIGGLEALAAMATSAGVPTLVALSGSPRPLPAAVDQAVYRIVQEALTNVICHAGSATAVVRLGYEPGRLVVVVADDGDGRPPAVRRDLPRGGHGIAGMRERAEALGGELQAAGRAGGGFRVHVALPLQGPVPRRK